MIIDILYVQKNENKNNTGFKLGPDSREKWLLPLGKLGWSDSQI